MNSKNVNSPLVEAPAGGGRPAPRYSTLARLLIGERPVHVAERRPAQAHDRDLDPRSAEQPRVVWSHQPASPAVRRMLSR